MAERTLLSCEATYDELQERYPDKDITAMIKWLSLAGASARVCLSNEMFDMQKVDELLGKNPSKHPAIGDIIQTFQCGTFVVTEIPLNREDIVIGLKIGVDSITLKHRPMDITAHKLTLSDAIFIKTSGFNMIELNKMLNEIKPHIHAVERLYDTIIKMTEEE